MGKFLHIGWPGYGKMAEELATKVLSKGHFDLVIGVARGGVPLAMVVSDRIGCRMDIINVKSYTGIGKRKAPKVISTITSSIRGKRVLLVDDLVDHGDTARFVTGYLKSLRPMSLTTAVLFTKPHSTFTPDLFIKSTGKWIVFPWEEGEFEREV
jgi:hypoxanthine phosphoribosyltransferase